MIRITFFKKNQNFYSFHSEGHADYARNGFDIVCSAVSALEQMILAAFLDQLSDETKIEWVKEDGLLKVQLSSDLSDEEQKTVNILFKALETGLKLIEEEYPKYVSVAVKKNGRETKCSK